MLFNHQSCFSSSCEAPTENERRGYYAGLRGLPSLVARSSTKPWIRPSSDKRLYPATGHLLQAKWNSSQGPGSLKQQIIHALAGIDWVVVDILRVALKGYSNSGLEFQDPVTMLVSVNENSTSFAQGYAVVCKCRDIIVRFGIDDVEVEMKEGKLIDSASTPSGSGSVKKEEWCAQQNSSELVSIPEDPVQLVPGPLDSESLILTTMQDSNERGKEPTRGHMDQVSYRHARHYSEYIGTSIASSDTPSLEATKGPILQDKKNNKTYSLTCRRAMFGTNDANAEYRHGAQVRTVIQPGQITLEELDKKLEEGKDALELADRRGDVKTFANKTGRTPHRTRHNDGRPQIPSLQPYQVLHDRWKSQDPSIGHVEFAPPVESADTPQRLRDWALVELYQHKHTTLLSSLTNKLPVDQDLGSLTKVSGWKNCVNVLHRCLPEAKLRSELIPEEELESPRTTNQHGHPGTLVLKQGASSSFTVGVRNGIDSVVRRRINNQVVISEEWCIVSENDNCFSTYGDLGSCVFDFFGRIGGIVTGAVGSQYECFLSDTTYVTPMRWLLEDIKAKGYDVELA